MESGRLTLFSRQISVPVGRLPSSCGFVPRVSDCLTDIAEVVVDHTLALSWRLVAERYGTPSGTVAERVSGFAVIGYGKLGGRELGYGSDLDLVFLCSDIRPEMVTEGPRPVSCFEF